VDYTKAEIKQKQKLILKGIFSTKTIVNFKRMFFNIKRMFFDNKNES